LLEVANPRVVSISIPFYALGLISWWEVSRCGWRRTVESPELTGAVDHVFVFTLNKYKKKDNLDAGIAQNIAQVCAIRSVERKLKHEELSDDCSYFGIATTLEKWVFIEVGNGTVRRSNVTYIDAINPDTIRTVIGRVVGLLKVCKNNTAASQESKEPKAFSRLHPIAADTHQSPDSFTLLAQKVQCSCSNNIA
jgi:hypothetical protein